MRKAKLSIELDKEAFRDKIVADIVERMIQIELQAGTYGGDGARRARQKNLKQMYTSLFADKDMSVFQFSQINALLKECSPPQLLRVFNTVIYLLKEGIIRDSKLARLLKFEHRFTTQGASYVDFIYLVNSVMFEEYTSNPDLMSSPYADKLFFSNCESLKLYDDEITSILNEWCESIKLNGKLTVSTRYAKMLIILKMAKQLFSSRGIDDLRRRDLVNIKPIVLLLEFLEYIDAKHRLADDLRHLLSFKDLLSGNGSHKFKEMCCVDNIFQYVDIRADEKSRRICKLDIPYGTPLFQDMVEYISVSSYREAAFSSFMESFYSSMGDYAVTDTTQLSMDTFKASAQFYCNSKDKKKFQSFLYSFYNHCYDKYRINFFEKDGVDIALIEKQGLMQRLNDGYAVVKYNPYDNVPSADKWVLSYNPKYDAATEHSPTNSITMDFSDVQNETFRGWLKEYAWRADKALKSKRTVVNVLKEALNYIHQIRTAQIFDIFCRDVAALDAPLTQSEIMAIRHFYLAQNTADVTKHSKIYNFRAFLKYLENHDITEIPGGTYYHMYHQNEPNNTSLAIPNEDLSLLTQVITNHAERSVQEDLYSVIYAIALDTNFRISKIISLKVDCVVETAKKGEYVVVARDKDATTGEVQEPITKETKRMIDHALEITRNLRQHAPDHLKSHLFITQQNGVVSVRALNRNNFTIYIKKCCIEAGIPEYTPANLRDTHMTLAKVFQIKNKLSNLELSALTGHKTPSVDIEHYVNMDIATMMEALHGIIIGNINLNGKIVKEVSTDIAICENEVSNGCGYCQSEYCKNLTYLDCIMCKDFVTMPSRLPFFEEQIKTMDMNIRNAKTPHDKEDYINIKRLLVAYESAIKTIEVTN